MWVWIVSTGPPPSALHSGAWRSFSTISSQSASPSSPSALTSALGIEDAREATAGIDDLAVPPGEPGANPVRALVEGERRPAVAADAPADHEAAGIDEAHVLEHATGRGHSDGERTQRRHRGGGGGDAPETESVRPCEQRGRQRPQHAAEGEAREDRVVHYRERSRSLDAHELLGERLARGANEAIAAAAVLLAGEADLAPAREPARAHVEGPRHTLAGGPDAEGEVRRRVRPLGDHPPHLVSQAQEHQAIAFPNQSVEERPR